VFLEREYRSARIDHLSVNSVLLARNSEDRHDVWLVAASVCHASNSRSMQLRYLADGSAMTLTFLPDLDPIQ
jgi:hypothetical protein